MKINSNNEIFSVITVLYTFVFLTPIFIHILYMLNSSKIIRVFRLLILLPLKP